jgi:hypothetical protein
VRDFVKLPRRLQTNETREEKLRPLRCNYAALGSQFFGRGHREPTGAREARPDDGLCEAIQSQAERLTKKSLDRFVALRLAMTTRDCSPEER